MKMTGWLQGNQWEEVERAQHDGVRWNEVHERWTLTGDLKGHGEVTYQLLYLPNGTVMFHGQEVLTGATKDKTGTLFVQTQGSFGPEGARATWVIQAGTGDFEGAQGQGGYHAQGHDPAPFFLEL